MHILRAYILDQLHVTMQKTIEGIQQILCKYKGCYTCLSCRQIADRSHHGLLWLSTQTSYHLDDVQPIHATLNLALSTDEPFFIVIEHAERLTTASANSLLKVLEEPPAGYHFLLLAERAEQLLITIRSRCIMHDLRRNNQQNRHDHPFLLFFTTDTAPDPLAFMQEIETATPTEQETLSLIDALIVHWHTKYRHAVAAQKKASADKASRAFTLFTKALAQPPMPGSSKLFWKNLFLQFVAL